MKEKILNEDKTTFYTVREDRGFYVSYYEDERILLTNNESRSYHIESISDAKRLAKKIGGIVTKHERIYTTKEFTEIVEVD